MEERIKGIAVGIEVRYRLVFGTGNHPTVNDPLMTDFLKMTAKDVVGVNGLKEMIAPSMCSECSSFYLQIVLGCYFYLGVSSKDSFWRSLGIGAGDEVIVPVYTFLAIASAVLEVNGIPIFGDINPDTYCMDPKRIEEVITSRTKAIIPVHIAGQPADMNVIMDIASKYDLAVLEDSVQAYGAEWRGKRVGSIGDIGSFSKCYSFHDRGRRRGTAKYEHHVLGQNFRLSQIHAAILMS